MTRPVAVLVGPPGAGKTTVGRLLAVRLGVAFRDTDHDVEQQADASIAELFVQEGEEHFRALERRAVTEALREHDGVLSLGGGAVLDPGIRALLHDHTVVFLDVGLGSAVQRVGLGSGRPLVGLNPRAQLRVLLEQRLPLYREVATHTVVTSGVRVDVVVEQVLSALAPE